MAAAKLQALTNQLDAYKIELMEARASAKQLAFAQAFHGHTHRTYAALGGNRSGKTILTGGLCFAKHLRDRARDGDLYWIVSPTSEKSVTGPQKFLWNTLPHWMFGKCDYDAKNGFDGQRPIITITLPNGRGHCVINFKNCEQDATTFESDSVHGVWVSESLPYEYFQRLIPRTIDHAAWILYDDIPEQDWHWLDLFNADPAAKVYCQTFEMWDNAANLPPGEIDLALARFSKEEADMRVWGKFRRLTGVVFREYDRLLHRITPFEIPSEAHGRAEWSATNWPRWRLLDVGGSAPTACAWVTIAPNERAYVYREYYQTYGNVKSHSAAIKDMSVLSDGTPETYVGNLIDPAAWQITAANDVSVADQYALEGLGFSPWPLMNVFGERAAVEIMKRRFAVNQLMIFQFLESMDRELGKWKYRTGKDGLPLASDAYENGNNHLIDCVKGWLATRPVFTVPLIRVRGAA